MNIGVFGDLHCGHYLGLTPPNFQNKNFELSIQVSKLWEWFVKEYPKKLDIAIWNGDLVDGEGKKESKSHLTTDVNQQIDMAQDIIKLVNAKRNIFIYGSPYHTGSIIDYEVRIAKYFHEDIKTCQKLDIDGIKFNISHPIGKTTVPSGGDIMLKNKLIWSLIYSTIDGIDCPDIIIRSHIHEYRMTCNPIGKVITTPALQLGSQDHNQYARKLDGWYHVGFLEFKFNKGDDPLTIYPIPHLCPYKISGGYTKI